MNPLFRGTLLRTAGGSQFVKQYYQKAKQTERRGEKKRRKKKLSDMSDDSAEHTNVDEQIEWPNLHHSALRDGPQISTSSGRGLETKQIDSMQPTRSNALRMGGPISPDELCEKGAPLPGLPCLFGGGLNNAD
jgi:hypothetical protein